jgi:uncharacterized protein YndB with AHSA1/START domain
VSERGYTIERTFDSPREVVWEAWTSPEHFAIWFGTEALEMRDVVFDLRPGGDWSGTMVFPNASTKPWHGVFRTVEAPGLLVMDITDSEVIGAVEYERYTLTLEADGAATRMTLRQSGGHLSDEEYERARDGTSSFMDSLAALLPGILKARHDAD